MSSSVQLCSAKNMTRLANIFITTWYLQANTRRHGLGLPCSRAAAVLRTVTQGREINVITVNVPLDGSAEAARGWTFMLFCSAFVLLVVPVPFPDFMCKAVRGLIQSV